MKKFLFFSLLIIGYTNLFGLIIESHTIKDVLTYVQQGKKTLVVFDLDNTLIKPKNHGETGSDHWLEFHVQRMVKDHGVEYGQAYEIILPIYYDIQLNTEFEFAPVEQETIDTFVLLQQQADKVIGLTARSYPIIDSTGIRLKDIGIDFTINGFGQNFMFKNGHGQYNYDIGFCGKGDKGQMLIEILEYFNYWPDVIIFIDDKVKCHHSVESVLLHEKISHTKTMLINIHYVHLADYITKFKPAYLLHT